MTENQTTDRPARSCQSFTQLVNSMLHSIFSAETGAKRSNAARRKLQEMFSRNDDKNGNGMETGKECDLGTGMAYMLSQTGREEFDQAPLRRLDTCARAEIASKDFDESTFAEAGRYLIMRYTNRHTSAADRLAVKSTLILNLFMLEALFTDTAHTGAGTQRTLRTPALELDPDELSIFNPNHRLMLSLNVLKGYYLSNLFCKKACKLFKALIETVEPHFNGLAPENRLYIGTMLKELKRCPTWPADHIESEMLFSRIAPDTLAGFEKSIGQKGRTEYKSLGRHYLVTTDRFFLPLN